MKNFKKILQKRLETATELEKDVIQYIVDMYDTDDEIITFFQNLSKGGCQSGMVSSMIYYHDTYNFFKKHFTEIFELQERLEEETETKIEPKGDKANWYAWFGFDETAYHIMNEIGIE